MTSVSLAVRNEINTRVHQVGQSLTDHFAQIRALVEAGQECAAIVDCMRTAEHALRNELTGVLYAVYRPEDS